MRSKFEFFLKPLAETYIYIRVEKFYFRTLNFLHELVSAISAAAATSARTFAAAISSASPARTATAAAAEVDGACFNLFRARIGNGFYFHIKIERLARESMIAIDCNFVVGNF